MNNCYTLSQLLTCHNISVNNFDLWHEILGNLTFKTLSTIAGASLVCGLPTLGKKYPSVCGSCEFEFSKEEKITSFSNEAAERFGADQNVETKSDNVAISADTVSGENVAIYGDQNPDDVDDETESTSTSVFGY